MFHIGQKVICVHPNEIEYSPGIFMTGDTDGLVKGQIYTIRWVGYKNYPNYSILGMPCVRLEEIIRRPGVGPQLEAIITDQPYWAGRFAPIEKKQTSIEVFEEMLTNIPELVDV